METIITNTLEQKKPFRGIACIQLRDKDTGEIVQEVIHENTYNDRIPVLSYMYSILANASSTVPYAETSFHYNPELRPYNEGIQQFYEKLSSFSFGATYTSSGINLFSTLLLTTNTKAEDPHGYFNGVPVGICDSLGTGADHYNYSCAGSFNIAESYLANDRLHLVFDFATDRCNVSFDSLWLLPGVSSRGASYVNRLYYPLQSYSYAYEKTDTIIPLTYSSVYISTIQNRYQVISLTNSNYSYRSTEITIFDRSSGEIIITYNWGTDKNIWEPFYYDAQNKILYTLFYNNGVGKYVFGQDDTQICVQKIDLTTGEITGFRTFKQMFHLDNKDYGYSFSKALYAYLCIITCKNGEIIFTISLRGKDDANNSKGYLVFLSFDPTTFNTTIFKKYEEALLTQNKYDPSNWTLHDDILYTDYPLDPNAAKNNYGTCFNIHTGAVLQMNCITAISYQKNVVCADGATRTTSATSGATSDSAVRLLDKALYRKPFYRLITFSSPTERRICKSYVCSSAWSTHNKLSTTVKKTDVTTMKIQYDIIFDSLSEQLIPKLL